MLRQLGDLDLNEQSFDSCKLEHFQHNKNLMKYLHAFVKVRVSKDIYSDDTTIPGKKGTRKKLKKGQQYLGRMGISMQEQTNNC